MMTRVSAREIAVQILFAHSFSACPAEELLGEWLGGSFYERLAREDPLYDRPPGRDTAEYIRRLVSGVTETLPELDALIETYAVGWALGRIPRTALSVMRAALYEIKYMPDVPAAAAINAHVNIIKHYESPEVASFVNGILGSYWRAENP